MQILLLDDGDGDLMASLVVNDDEVEYTTNMIRARCPKDWKMTWLAPESSLDDILEWAEEQ